MRARYFTELNYTLGDEDPIVEYELFPERCMNPYVISGSGGRILPLLAKQPTRINCVDILNEQLLLTELRVETVKQLDFEPFCGFWGYPPSTMTAQERQAIFDGLSISDEARGFLGGFFAANEWREPIYMGKFEKMLIQLASINKLITGRAGRGLFHAENLEKQNDYYERRFPHTRWNLVLFVLGNSTVLNSLLYKGDFPKKNIDGSTFRNFKRIYDSIFRTIPLKDSFFAQLSFWGHIEFPEANFPEARRDFFDKIKRGASSTEINYIQGDIFEIVKNSPRPADFVSLSDVPSFIQGDQESTYLQRIKSNVANNALVVVRGNLRVTHPDFDGFKKVEDDFSELLQAESTQLWHIDIYRRC